LAYGTQKRELIESFMQYPLLGKTVDLKIALTKLNRTVQCRKLYEKGELTMKNLNVINDF
jgi:hypothetical protein